MPKTIRVVCPCPGEDFFSLVLDPDCYIKIRIVSNYDTTSPLYKVSVLKRELFTLPVDSIGVINVHYVKSKEYPTTAERPQVRRQDNKLIFSRPNYGLKIPSSHIITCECIPFIVPE
jgi:hypothetical protein